MFEFYMHLVGSDIHKHVRDLTEQEAFALYEQAKGKAHKVIAEADHPYDGTVRNAMLLSNTNKQYTVAITQR